MIAIMVSCTSLGFRRHLNNLATELPPISRTTSSSLFLAEAEAGERLIASNRTRRWRLFDKERRMVEIATIVPLCYAAPQNTHYLLPIA